VDRLRILLGAWLERLTHIFLNIHNALIQVTSLFKEGFMKKLVLLGLFVLLVCSCTQVTNSFTPIPKSYQVTYYVSEPIWYGNAYMCNCVITYDDVPIADVTKITSLSTQALPWTKTIILSSGNYVGLIMSPWYWGPNLLDPPTGTLGYVTASIYINGVVIWAANAAISASSIPNVEDTYLLQ